MYFTLPVETNGWIALAGCQTKMSVNGFLSPLMMYAIMMIVFLELAMVDNNLDGTMPVELALLSDSLCKCIHFGPVCCFG